MSSMTAAAAAGANTQLTAAAAPILPAVSGVNPGDPCRDSEGREGRIRTPGSVIKDTLNRVMGGEQDRITRMGNVGPMINNILNNIATVVRTANFAAEILGGSSGGLLGVDGGSAVSPTTRLIQYQAAPPLGATGAAAVGNSGALSTSAADMLARVTAYETAWNAIRSAADGAKANLDALESSCASQSSAAQTARADKVDPVLAAAATAAAIIVDARAAAERTQVALNSGSASYATELQALQTMRPTVEDVVNATRDSTAAGGATANPVGSLTVSGGSTVDQMTLLRDNAQSLQASCPAP